MENKNLIKYLIQGVILLTSSAIGFLTCCTLLWVKLGLPMSVSALCANILISFLTFCCFINWIASDRGEDK